MASPTTTHHKVVRKSSAGSLLGKIAILVVLAAIFFGAWHYHTCIAPGKVVAGLLQTANKQDWAAMKKYVTKASVKRVPGKSDEDEATESAPPNVYLPEDSTFTIKGVSAGFSRGTVKVELKYRVEGVEQAWTTDWPVAREGLSWRVDLKAMVSAEESADDS